MSLISGSSKGVKAPPQTSSPSHNAVGSGSRPTPSKFKIEDSSPEDPHTQGRGVPGALGMGKMNKRNADNE